MPEIEKNDAAERLAKAVEKAAPDALGEYYAELFPDAPPQGSLVGIALAEYIRNRVVPEEIVNLWNVVFPEDHNVWYNEETNVIHYNEELAEYAD